MNQNLRIRQLSRLAKRLTIGGVIALALLSTMASAGAHSFLVEATPSSKDHVSEPRKIVRLRFGGGVDTAYSKPAIEFQDGKVLADGAVGAAREAARTHARRANSVAGPVHCEISSSLPGRAHCRRQLWVFRGREVMRRRRASQMSQRA